MPDGSAVPMWGYSCGAVVGGSTATCAKSNPAAAGWSPVVITVPTGQTLQINLTNSLTFGAQQRTYFADHCRPVGRRSGKRPPTRTASPDHAVHRRHMAGRGPRTTTNTPPPQEQRVQSFSTEVAAGATTRSDVDNASRRARTCLSRARIPPFRVPWACTAWWW